MGKITKKNFFKEATAAVDGQATEPIENANVADGNTEAPKAPQPQETPQAEEPSIPRVVQLPRKVMEDVKETANMLNSLGFKALAQEVARIYHKAANEPFTIAVVGEFSRGKSTLINRILGQEILPTSNLPTTALLTRIVYGKVNKMNVYGRDGKKLRELPLSSKSWDGLVAANFGEKEPEGYVVVEVNNPWLGKYGINIIDTPGAGDLEESRARVIEECIKHADAAIISVSAISPLSMTEETFIRQKVLARGLPFVALAVTKLDLVSEADRKKQLEYFGKRLELMKIKMPVLLADDTIAVETPDTPVIMGLEGLKGLVYKWLSHPQRTELTLNWLKINITATLNSAMALLMEKKELLEAKDSEKERIIAERSKALTDVHEQWQDLRNKFADRCLKAIADFNAKAKEGGESIAENLEHEVDRVPNPKQWLDKEYAYRVKRELNALSMALDNVIARAVAADIRWLNREMSQRFKQMVGIDPEALEAKENFRPDVDGNHPKFDDIKDHTTKSTLVCSALTVGAALLLGLAHGPVLLATLGVGTGSNFISRKLLERKVESQREELKKLIAKQMPQIIKEATSESAVKIKLIYNDIINECYTIESKWMQSQRDLIRQAVEASTQKGDTPDVDKMITEVEGMKQRFGLKASK